MNTEKQKCDKYNDLNTDKYSFIPFIIESGGAVGESALSLCAKLRKIMEDKCCSGRNSIGLSVNPSRGLRDITYITHDPLLVSLSVLLQIHNGQMIMEQQPPSDALIDNEIERCQTATRKYKDWAIRKLDDITTYQPSALQRVLSIRLNHTENSLECEYLTRESEMPALPTTPQTMEVDTCFQHSRYGYSRNSNGDPRLSNGSALLQPDACLGHAQSGRTCLRLPTGECPGNANGNRKEH